MIRKAKKLLKAEVAAGLANLRLRDQQQQLFIRSVRRDLAEGRSPPEPAEMTLSVHSQHEEDGILRIPTDVGHGFRTKWATHSGGCGPLIPTQVGHPFRRMWATP